MKTKLYTFAILYFFSTMIYSQTRDTLITKPNGGLKQAYRMKKSDTPAAKTGGDTFTIYHQGVDFPSTGVEPEPAEQGYDPNFNLDPQNCQSIFINKKFEANNMAGGTPADNYLAISNSGRIVSVDNYSIIEYTETSSEISSTRWKNFFIDPTLGSSLYFDPKVLYDSYDNKFILVVLYHNADYSDSRVLVSFSNAIGSGPLTWNHYDFVAGDFFLNTPSNKYWFDYPNIAINKDELFIALNAYRTNTNPSFQKPFVLQIDKSDGYNNNATIDFMEYTEFFSGSDYAYNLLPVCEGLQDNGYQNVMYFVNNLTRGSVDMWWRKLTGNLQGNPQFENHYFTSPIYYNIASYASQKGGLAEDRIRIVDNRIMSGFYKDSKIHFVFHTTDSGWMEIAYFELNTSTNSVTSHTYGGAEYQINYLYPSIACLSGVGSTTNKVIINFNRTSPNMYVDLTAIDFQNGSWGCYRTMRKGDGILDLRVYDGTPSTYERLGDYTSIQRKYNSNKAWLVGSYPFGAGPNNNGATDGLNAWISEVNLFSLSPTPIENNTFTIYPNPNTNGTLNFAFGNDDTIEKKIIVRDFMGHIVVNQKLVENTIQLPNLTNGIYFVEVITNNKSYETHKLIIN